MFFIEVPLGSTKCGVFLDKFRNCQLFKNPAPWSYLANPSSRCNIHVLK